MSPTLAERVEAARNKTNGQFGEQHLTDPGSHVLAAAPELEDLGEPTVVLDPDDEPTVVIDTVPGEPEADPETDDNEPAQPPTVKRRLGMFATVAAPVAAGVATAFSGGEAGAALRSATGQVTIVGLAVAAIAVGWLLTKLVDLPDW